MKLLLHTCCAPCSVYCIDSLRKEGIEPTVYWFNPNIHPYMEYKARRDTLKEYTKSINANAIFEENYGLVDFCQNVVGDLNNRCKNYCYPVRLEQTAKYAKENGYTHISTTLLISPYQNQEAIVEIGEKMAKKYDVEFLYRDFKVGFREGQAKAKQLGLYMQKYCGCVFSEKISSNNHILSDSKNSIMQNKITEKKIRLGWDVSNLELKQHKNGNQEEIKFIYNLENELYEKYRKKVYKEWNEENQKKLFEKFMKKYAKTIYIIVLNGKKIGFYNGENKNDNIYEIVNICIIPEYQNKGIGTAVIKEILFENKGKESILQCFKDNPAYKLYERMGFKIIEETEYYYNMKRFYD